MFVTDLALIVVYKCGNPQYMGLHNKLIQVLIMAGYNEKKPVQTNVGRLQLSQNCLSPK